MSLPIWTPAALSSEARSIDGAYWRLVEAQHRVSTLKLTDTLAEQALLEDLLEDSKPPLPADCERLDYLLATPFRYGAVYPHGSRFRRAGRTLGVYYAAASVTTALAEMAFYRLLFYAESPDTPLPANAAEYTAFSAPLRSDRVIDLGAPPLDRDSAAWEHPLDYAACQALADTARAADLDAILYRSVRDPGHGRNIAVLAPRTFAAPAPLERQTWRIRLHRGGAQALREFPTMRLEFSRADFAADPRIAMR